MIDIHCHPLPGIDDGPRNWEESLALCAAMYGDGIRTAVATPHLIDGVYENVHPMVGELTAELCSRLAHAGNELEVFAGAEVDISSNRLIQAGGDLPLLGDARAVLMEMPVAVIPSALGDIIFAVRSRGLLPVLAHPERNQLLQDRPELARAWVEAGAALQVDGDSLLGVWGRGSRRCAERLLLDGIVHALASDAHSTDRRPPRLAEAVAAAESILGAQARKLVEEGPAEILAGRLPPTPLYEIDLSAPGASHDRPRGLRAIFSRRRNR